MVPSEKLRLPVGVVVALAIATLAPADRLLRLLRVSDLLPGDELLNRSVRRAATPSDGDLGDRPADHQGGFYEQHRIGSESATAGQVGAGTGWPAGIGIGGPARTT